MRSESTGVVQTANSNASGDFSVLDLPPGVYTLTAEAAGFSGTVQEHIVVSVGSTVSLVVPLKVGAVQQSVVVAADVGGVQTETSDIGTAIIPEEIKDLPLSLSGDMRNPLNFVLSTPRVAGSTPGATPDYRIHISGSVSYAKRTKLYEGSIFISGQFFQCAQPYHLFVGRKRTNLHYQCGSDRPFNAILGQLQHRFRDNDRAIKWAPNHSVRDEA